jgi:hypothetical protein
VQVRFEHHETTVSRTLADVAARLPAERVSLGELLEMIGEQGVLVFCILLSVPFLFPVSIPGASIPFGTLIALIGIGVALDRVPWLPRWLMTRTFASPGVRSMLDRSARWFAKIEKVVHPRLLLLTHGKTLNRLNGVALAVSGLALMAPIPPLMPLSNTFPGWACLLFSIGISQRDGYVVIAAWISVVLTLAYFIAFAILGVELVEWLTGCRPSI